MKPPWSLLVLSLVVRQTVTPPCLNKGNLLLLRSSFLFCLAGTMPYSLPECQPSDGIRVGLNTLKTVEFIYLWLLVWTFSSCIKQVLLFCCGVQASRFWRLVFLQSTGSRRADFSSCSTQAQNLWHTGLASAWHVESSQTRSRIHVPLIVRWIPNHCTTNLVFIHQIFIESLQSVETWRQALTKHTNKYINTNWGPSYDEKG